MLKVRLDHVETNNQVGIDEAGRGPLLGRVYAAAVLLPEIIPPEFADIKDSKKFSSPKKLKRIAELIMSKCRGYGVGYATCTEVDSQNVRVATYTAMHRAITKLSAIVSPAHLIVDGNDFKPYYVFDGDRLVGVPHTCVPQGDSYYMPVAAASIVAKYERDKYITNLVNQEPDLDRKYCLLKNKGYGTKEHLDGIREHGISEWHRKTFGICKQYVVS